MEKLQALGEGAPRPEPAGPAGGAHADGTGNGQARPGQYASHLLVEKWLKDRGVTYRAKLTPDAQGRTVYVLAECPFDPTHGDPDSCIMQAPDGKLSAQCFHNSCTGRGWQEFKEKLGKPDPDHYDPPLSARQRQEHQGKGQAESSADAAGDGLITTPLGQIRPEPVRWEVDKLIPSGKLSLLAR